MIIRVLGIGLVTATAFVAAMQAIGGNLREEFEAQEAVARAAEAEALTTAETVEGQKASDEIPSQMAMPRRAGATMLEQAIFDAFPITAPKSRSEKKIAANAADFVAASINAQGYLCARPIEMQKAADGQYGIGCITQRDGYGRANYLVDVRSGSVAEI